MVSAFENGEANTAWRTDSLGLAHKHVAEMKFYAGMRHAPLFAPSVARTMRGMVVDVPLVAAAMPVPPSADAIRDVLRAAYDPHVLVTVIDAFDDAELTIEHAAGTDRLDLFVFANVDIAQIRLVAALDNLGKGAGGACIQSLNIIAGLDETAGLRI